MKTAAFFCSLILSGCLPFGLLAETQETEWKMHTIESANPETFLNGADGVRLADVNGNGLLDIATGWEEGKSIRIYLNPGPERVREAWPVVEVGRVEGAEDAVFADLDGDGRMDVISATEGKSRTVFVHWSPAALEDIADGSKWATDSFPSTVGKQWWMFSLPYDVDRDGAMDLVLGSKNVGGSVSWLRNPGHERARDLDAWEEIRLADAGWIMSLRILSCGEDDYLLYSDRKGSASGIYLMPLLKEAPWHGDPVLIGAGGEEVMFLDIAHLDHDERLDIVAAIRPDKIIIFHQPEDPLHLWEDTTELDSVPSELYGTVKAVRAGDLSGDGSPDFAITCELAKDGKRGVLRSNLHSEFLPVSDAVGIKYDRIELVDLDGDGDLDILTCEETAGLGVVWFENPAN